MSTKYSLLRTHCDAQFFGRLISIGLPIALQTMLFSSRSLVDILMLGQLGEADVAAIGVAGKALFVATILIFGVTTGGSLLTAQYWGAGNIEGFRRKTALTAVMTTLVAIVFAFIFLFIPDAVMGLATNDSNVIYLGSQYLQITSVAMITIAMGSSLNASLRTMNKPGIGTAFSFVGISLNLFLNWVLIFGNLGFPALGIAGAAWATMLSGIVEVVLFFLYVYRKKFESAFGLQHIIAAFDPVGMKRFLSLSLPVALNHLIWSSGMFVYHAILGQAGVEGLAALSVITPIESFALAMLIGISNAASVVMGNQLGANKLDAVYPQAWGIAAFSFIGAVFVAGMMLLVCDPILSLFSALSPSTMALTEKFYWVFAGMLIIKSVPMSMIVGVLRAGGDIRYCLYQDIAAQWLIGIPVVAFAALVLKVPLEWVYALFAVEEMVKWVGSVYRVRAKVWIKNLVEA
ncbi:MATE family efflux transporter [Enterovibrio nigricans]|uniref:Multidrug resistance protein NorM n=1 Tax=Enterovibrio nigricans DSM 22720 TaxID=1121868 RepID=A0A1T4VV10_9GAMM|nr:MATE family efflux transporter [Enterovibrio nigricans]SKA68844.1 putative efflux protein, MATE family [Enterovibrio nigricans DSM 22720]